MKETKYRHSRFLDRYFGGHVNIGRVTLYGYNAMHFAANIRLKRTWLCIHPPVRCFGVWWPWSIYVSRDGTPSGRTWGIGPGLVEWRTGK